VVKLDIVVPSETRSSENTGSGVSQSLQAGSKCMLNAFLRSVLYPPTAALVKPSIQVRAVRLTVVLYVYERDFACGIDAGRP
jgi:hypothetical protein